MKFAAAASAGRHIDMDIDNTSIIENADLTNF
jgi:hypothetical protein